jgi:hypothetical protein
MNRIKLIEAAVGEAYLVRLATGEEDGTFEIREHEDVDRGTVRVSTVLPYSEFLQSLTSGRRTQRADGPVY